MIKEALSFLVNLGARDPFMRDLFGGVTVTNQQLNQVPRPRADSLIFSRLQGFADFVNTTIESLDRKKVVIHVASPYVVRFLSTLHDSYRNRECYAEAQFDNESIFAFGNWQSPEEFVIDVMTLFSDSDKTDRARLLALVGQVGAEAITTSADDGVSQTVTQKNGLMFVGRKKVDNPFKLAPFRTFAELKAQPASPFILRARQDRVENMPEIALFECDNGAWQIDAIQGIQEWLKSKIKDIPILA